ncbi:FMN-binding protein [Burkholderia diffusa]|uniref:FMN-binding protein n=1 Tax=Burkholderia diffusa TaxID=488732 RepID=A0AAW3PFV6_9BURK|nr:FMN-binding protein [Burkholderia diffusa]KUZ16513.1 FMN-binding protein [Burkholderia diffusa]KVC23630.1 FMN-binding protein [Burkholderia diffusa]KVC50085.1 FMN-binding protein [Burkholderia diffusa]KVH46834.1 FMN-binding protein [Burkholderia diffusa]KWF26954.1 FMN-binding protein [Burkholderia diffusa]
MKHGHWVWLPVAAISTSVYATTYFTTEQAQQAIFPGEKLTPAFVTLTDDQVGKIEHATGTNVRHKEVKAWRTATGGWFVLDEVVGKHEFITYAVGLQPDGSVRQIEIMDYRESYGHEVRNPEWRAQFTGKTANSPLALNRDIRNISGATLSSKHITDGVKRVLETYAVALK